MKFILGYKFLKINMIDPIQNSNFKKYGRSFCQTMCMCVYICINTHTNIERVSSWCNG